MRQKSFNNLINLLSVFVFARSFGSKFVNEKSPAKCFYALFCLLLFMQNLFLLHQRLVIVLVARIRLLRILEVHLWRAALNDIA